MILKIAVAQDNASLGIKTFTSIEEARQEMEFFFDTLEAESADEEEMKTNTQKYSKHPIQPTYQDSDGVVRFKANAIVRYLLDAGPFDLNQLAFMPFDDNDWEQFAQLIGYSLSGFGELNYVSDETYNKAKSQALGKGC